MPLGVEINDGVALVEMQDPPHNFLSADQVREIVETMLELDANMDVRCAVLAAQGRSFCAGANFAGGDNRLRSSPSDLYAEAARMFEVQLPIVAAVHGPAIGGGLGLAMATTFRVTCPEARFSANFVKLGIHQGFGLSVTLPELLGPSKAALVLLTGRRFNGQEAMEIGLADVCVAADEVRPKALELAGEIASGAPLAIRSIHATLRAGLADRIREITKHEAAEQARLFATQDSAEGMRSVAERRPGNFTGR
jgi:2-(1,2-epoxy-1,2-dihydrophenyl)acetyl-CoA isomerase